MNAARRGVWRWRSRGVCARVSLKRLVTCQPSMRVAFYNSSLATGGGGEKYFLSVVEEAVAGGDEVTILSPEAPDFDAWRRLGVGLTPADFTWRRADDRSVTPQTFGCDLAVIMSWSLPLILAKRSVNIVQFPPRQLRDLPALSDPARLAKVIAQRWLMHRYDKVVCYSEFVRSHILSDLRRNDAVVVYPPFSPVITEPREKSQRILCVGRFFPTKRQDALIEAFRKLSDGSPSTACWELHMVGGLEPIPEAHEYFRRLLQQAEGLPVFMHPNLPLEDLRELYESSAIFWHAAGLGYEERPDKQEHFGITTVEAMSFGCVPAAINLGGQPEIVADGETGFVWSTLEDLIRVSLALVEDPELREEMSKRARQSVDRFSMTRFRREAREVILAI